MLQRKIISKLSIFFIFFLLFSCIKKPEQRNEIIIYTSIYPFEHFTQWIAPKAFIESLVPHGVDPHHFEPSLRDIQKLYNASLVIYMGDTDVDGWIDKIKDELIKKGVQVLRLKDHLEFKNYKQGNEIDPHIWLDPVEVAEIIRLIKEKLQNIDQVNKELYEKNFLTYEAKLKELDKLYQKELSVCEKKDVIVTHEFLNYLASRYGFNAYFIVHEPEQEPSLKKIKELKYFMAKNSINSILVEPEGKKIAKTLSEETKANLLKFNTFHMKTDFDYFQTMQENLKSLKIALKCKL